MTPEEASAELYELWFRLNRCYERMGDDSGLPQSQRYALFLLESGPLTQREMRAMTLWPKQTANSVVHALAERGWVELATRETDRRSKEVRLTEAGRAEAARLNQPIRDAEISAIAALSEQRLAAMLGALGTYVQAMETAAMQEE